MQILLCDGDGDGDRDGDGDDGDQYNVYGLVWWGRGHARHGRGIRRDFHSPSGGVRRLYKYGGDGDILDLAGTTAYSEELCNVWMLGLCTN